MPKERSRLILCFDGTWNTPEDRTNVYRLYSAIPDFSTGCSGQFKFYDEGVGTSVGSKITGGAFGIGLHINMLQGYCWLIEHYEPMDSGQTILAEPASEAGNEDKAQSFHDGDHIFLFGFSRGAFTARSLAGLINRCGIPRRDQFGPGEKVGPSHPLIQQAWKLYREDFNVKLANGKDGLSRNHVECENFRQKHSWVPKIRFVGVWDTVGAMGVPFLRSTHLPWSPDTFRFHDTSLGRVIENGYHACAIDENRRDFEVTLWTARTHQNQTVEQRWFPGAHANVGGGYDDDQLPDPPLKWLAERAIAIGLEFRNDFLDGVCSAVLPRDLELTGNEYLGVVRDSYKEFMYGIYAPFAAIKAFFKNKTSGRWHRPMLVYGVNETIDETATLKQARDPDYRPPNLAHVGRDDLNAAEPKNIPDAGHVGLWGSP